MAIDRKTKLRIKRAFRHITPNHIARTRATRQAIQDFAERTGLVYFGYVDQHDDDHRLVRGYTVSHTHIDNHLSIGTIHGYDISVLQRRDTVQVPQENQHRLTEKRCHWLIATVDLHVSKNVPHIFIGTKADDAIYRSSYSALRPLILGATVSYSPSFLQKYTVYGSAEHGIEIEQIFIPQITDILVSHFSATDIEIEHNTLYLYTENPRPTEAQVEKHVANALWLAEAIDTVISSRQSEQQSI